MTGKRNVKYQVFISSTYEDLIQERNEVTLSLLDIGCIPVGMEQFPASSISQMEYIEKMFQTTDFIVLIIAGRYGSINKETGLSYTESEIQLAKKMKIPILVFMLNENAIENLPVKYSESDSVLKEKLSLFRNSFKQTLINFYSDKEDLKLKIIKSVNQFIKDNDLTGWIRADEFSNEIKEKDDVINSLEVKIKNLETTTSEIELEPPSNSEVINALRIGELEAEKTDLSLEAQELLKEAAISTSGQIKYLKVLGEPTLSVNGKEMLLEKDNRTISFWEAGLEELENEGYIKSNPKREIFKITKLGYKYADYLNNI